MPGTNSGFRGAGFFRPSSTPSGNRSRLNTPSNPLNPAFPLTDTTPPSSMVSLHQKIDMILANNADQKAAIDDLKKENAGLKEQLDIVNSEFRALKEVNGPVNSVGNQGKIRSRLPPGVSVSRF